MTRIFVYVLFVCSTSFINAQFYADISSGYSLKGGLLEVRAAMFLNSNTALSASGTFYLDSYIYETFPRVGVLNLYRNKAGNFNIASYGLQISGIGAQRDLSKVYDKNFLRLSPFINFRRPILSLKRNCNCGKPSGLILELVGDLNFNYPFIGIGLRKGLNNI